MEKRRIKKSIDIAAPREQVWDVLFTDAYLRTWYAYFSEGSHAVTDWQEGSKAVFTDNTRNGVVGSVLVNKPLEELSVEFEGIVVNDKEIYDGEHALQMKGGRETYRLTEKNGLTHLAIESDMPEKYFEAMSKAWDQALLRIAELATVYPFARHV